MPDDPTATAASMSAGKAVQATDPMPYEKGPYPTPLFFEPRACNSTSVLSPTGVVHTGDNALPGAAVDAAVRLVGAVHEHGPDDVAGILGALTRRDLLALAVALAAMVPDDYTPVELLAWNDSRYARVVTPPTSSQPPLFPVVAVTRQLKPHGTHAAFVLHRKHREEPCDPCWHGEREYQRNRKRGTRGDDRHTA